MRFEQIEAKNKDCFAANLSLKCKRQKGFRERR
jgi:hypothetical protein